MRRLAAFVSALAIACLAASPVAAGKPANACPPGFNLGAQTLADWLALPRTQAAIADGVTTTEDVTAWFEGFDKNGDGYVCAQLSTGFQKYGPFSVYSYNASDDNASVPN